MYLLSKKVDPFGFAVIQVLGVVAVAGGLSGRAVVALRVGHAFGISEAELVFESEGEAFADVALEGIVTSGCRRRQCRRPG